MNSAFIPLVARAFSGVPCQAFTQSSTLIRRIPSTVHNASSQRPRMQFSSTGGDDVPDLDALLRNMKDKIKDSLQPTRVQIKPAIGDPNGAHVEIEVISDKFEGMSPVKRHRAVYKAIWEELSGPVHAVDRLVTKTPAEDGTSS